MNQKSGSLKVSPAVSGQQDGSMEAYDLEAPAPAHLLTDYIEVVYLPAAVCVGTILNALVFRRLWRKWRRLDATSGQRRSFLLLKLNLNIADFMVLLIYAFGRFWWVVAYQWYGGATLCRAYHFLSLVAFHMTAFVMVTIALERVKAVYRTVPLRQNKDGSCRLVRNMLALGWTLAVILSSGQWCVWTVFAPPFKADFVQCTTIWEIRKVQNSTLERNSMRGNGGISETAYMMTHLLSAFWIPLVVIAISYTVLCIRYLNHVLAMAGRQHRHVSAGTALLPCNEMGNGPVPLTGQNSRGDSQSEASSGGRTCSSRRQQPVAQLHQQMSSIHCKSKVFRTSGLVILCYLCCWTPYNVMALWKVVDPLSFYPLSEQLNILNALIVLNSVFNPLVYGFH